MDTYWYRVEVQTGGEIYCYYGSSNRTEEDFTAALARHEYVMLADLTYFDDEGHPRRWTDWDAHVQTRIYLNPRHVVSVLPLVEDPRKSGGEPNKVLMYPGHRPPPAAPPG